MTYGIGDYTGSDREAEYTYRDLYKAQWEDYKNRYLPYQDQLLDAVTSTEMLDEQLSRITAVAGESSALSMQGAEMARGRYGMQQTDAQRQSFEQGMALNEAGAMASARNNARSAAYDRYQSTMTGAGIRPEGEFGSTGGASGT